MIDDRLNKKNIFWNFLGLTINSFNSLFFLIIINRINGAYDGGIFTYSFSLMCLAYFIGTYYNRTFQVSNIKYKNSEFLINRVISCILMLALTILFLFILKYNFFKTSIIILICIFRIFEALADSFYGILQKQNLLYKAGFSMFIKGLLGILIFLLVDFIFKSLILGCLSLIFINLIGIIVYDIPNSKKYLKNDFKIRNVFNLYKECFPIFVFSFLNIYLVNSSKYTLDYYTTAEIQNIFGIILMPGTILSLCSQYLLNPYLLKLSDYYNNNKICDFNNILKKLFKYISIIGIMCLFGAYAVGIPILNIIYNIDLSDYKHLLIMIIIGSMFLAFLSILSTALTIMKKNYIQMYIYICCSIISLVLSVYLISKFSILGASINYVLVMIIQCIIYFIFYEKYMKEKGEKNEK